MVIHIAYLISASWLNKILFMGVTPHGSVELVRSGVFANIHWGLIDIGGTGDILFLIGCVRAGLVLLGAANESGTDTDGAGDGAHDILGERSGLVSADDGGVCHRLTRTEGANEEIFLIRFVAKVSAGDGYRKREAFQNSDNNQCH